MLTMCRAVAGVSLSLLTVACSADLPPAPSASQEAFAVSTDGQLTSVEQVGRAIALSLRDRQVRIAVRDAMRASPFTEHKLVLQDFVETPAGVGILDAAARASGLTTEALRGLIAGLPALDFYVSGRANRRSWRGGANVEVAVILDVRTSTFSIFQPDGRRSAPTAAEVNAPGRGKVLLVLHPAEPKGIRIGAQRDVPGEVIQDADDGEWGGQIIRYLPDGRIVVKELASLVAFNGGRAQTGISSGAASALTSEGCDETAIIECGVDPIGGGLVVPRDTTLLRSYIVIGLCDGPFCEDNELEWRAHFFRDGVRVDRADIRIEGVTPTEERLLNAPLIFQRVKRFGEEIIVDIVETDTFHDDDYYLPRPVLRSASDRGTHHSGLLRCESSPRYSCDGLPEADWWTEVNSEFWWTFAGI
ncbi:MAG: hypothetical protein ACREON_15235 [Gemmatimonadaceae bacterium]